MLNEIQSYLRYQPDEWECSLGEIYGTESFCWLVYALVLAEKPRTILELGTGVGGTALLAAEAARLNGTGHVWTVDDGREWPLFRQSCQAALGYSNESQSHADFTKYLFQRFEVASQISVVSGTLSDHEPFNPGRQIDLLFADAGDSGPVGCLELLRSYLPLMAPFSSIIIDRASTIAGSRLVLRDIVAGLNSGKLARSLCENLSTDSIDKIATLSRCSQFSITDLLDSRVGKANRLQNGRAWIRIEPFDCFAARILSDVYQDAGRESVPIKFS